MYVAIQVIVAGRLGEGEMSTFLLARKSVCIAIRIAIVAGAIALPVSIAEAQSDWPILTPAPAPTPRINGPRVYGVRPGSPFLFRIPATGARLMTFSVDGLPEGLSVDANTGIISGTIAGRDKKTYELKLHAKNANGEAGRDFRIVVGDTLALTPPMGWNHWYAHYDRITDAMVREAADVMISSGMADVGYQYVNIDDCWTNSEKNKDPQRVGTARDDKGNIVPNAHFPDMHALTDYIHAKGLKAGIYISPGPLTCGGYTASYQHEAQDAAQFAAWGFDFLKYDWCSYDKIAKDKSLPELKKPYEVMGALLKTQPRDIVFNLCQYGMGDVWTWGESVGGNCWRTAGDLGVELTKYQDVAVKNAAHAQYARPGAWNDPDYLQIGYVGDARNMGTPVRCPLTANEQYSFMSLWCLMAAPLVYSGDMSRLDAFTVNVLCNPEVIDVDQDPLGKQGAPVVREPKWEIWKKELDGGACAVALLNLGDKAQTIVAKWDAIGVSRKQTVRDLWRQQDLGAREGSFDADVPPHGVMLVRIAPGG